MLVIGNGPSGRDLVCLLSRTTNQITWSQRIKQIVDPNEIPSTVRFKGEVIRFSETGAEFVDNTHEEFSVIIYATGVKINVCASQGIKRNNSVCFAGYNFEFAFLSNDTGIIVDNNYVQPLFKHVVNIEYPTMAFLGIATGPTLPTLDLQAKKISRFRFSDR